MVTKDGTPVPGGVTAIGEQPIKGLLSGEANARMSVGEAVTNIVWAKVPLSFSRSFSSLSLAFSRSLLSLSLSHTHSLSLSFFSFCLSPLSLSHRASLALYLLSLYISSLSHTFSLSLLSLSRSLALALFLDFSRSFCPISFPLALALSRALPLPHLRTTRDVLFRGGRF